MRKRQVIAREVKHLYGWSRVGSGNRYLRNISWMWARYDGGLKEYYKKRKQ